MFQDHKSKVTYEIKEAGMAKVQDYIFDSKANGRYCYDYGLD